MGQKIPVKPARVALDTNILISALLFREGRLVWLRHAWQKSQLIPLVNHDTTSELIRVLGYPKFQLTRSEQKGLLAEFLPFAEAIRMPSSLPTLPEIRDPVDRMFLALAHHAKADVLVSGDTDLLVIHDKSWHIPVLNPPEFSDWLGKQSASTL